MAELSLDGLLSRLSQLRTETEQAVREEVETVALAAKATIELRIVYSGKDAEGNPFKPYTERYRKKKEDAKRFRGFVDFTFTGQLWSSIGIIEQKQDGNDWVVSLSGRDETSRAIMEGLDGDRKRWFTLSQDEIKVLTDEAGERMVERLRVIVEQ